MVLDPIPQSLPVHFCGSRPQPPTSHIDYSHKSTTRIHLYICIHYTHIHIKHSTKPVCDNKYDIFLHLKSKLHRLLCIEYTRKSSKGIYAYIIYICTHRISQTYRVVITKVYSYILNQIVTHLTCMYVYICMYVCTYVCIYVCMYVYVYM